MPTDPNDPVCRRCGICCRKGGPGLHAEDLPLIADGTLPRNRLVTLRAGEPVYDNVAGRVEALAEEMLKVRDLDSRACPFLEGEADCLIHGRRPRECRLLFCEAPQALMEAYGRDRLTRRDVLPPGSAIFELVRHHEERCPAAKAAALARRAARQDAAALRELGDMIRFDETYRELLVTRAGVAADESPFYLGRPLRQVLRPLLPALADRSPARNEEASE